MNLVFGYKISSQTTTHFFLVCPNFRDYVDILWSNLENKFLNHSETDRTHIANYIDNLGRHHKNLLLLGRYH